MKKPMVSVIVPTYNRDEPLRKTLKSLLAQDYPNFEIIVVDQSDKKFPEKEKFLKRYSQKIRLFSGLSPNAAAARNFGAKKARGEILLFVDDDVDCRRGLISAHVANYKDPQIGAVVGRIITEGQKEEPAKKDVGRISPWGSFSGGWSSKVKQEVFDAITCNASWKKRVFEKVGGFDEKFSGPIREDSDLAIRTRQVGYKIIFEPKAQLVHLRAQTGGFRKTESRFGWYFGFFKSEAYFCLKHISWFWWPVFWLARWQWFLRCMFGFGREVSWRSITAPFAGIAAGVRDFRGGGGIKIGVEAGCLGVKDERLKVGVYRVTFNLVKELGILGRLGRLGRNWQILLYSFLPIGKAVMREFGPGVRNVVVGPSFGWNFLWLPWQILKDGLDIFIGPSQSLPTFCPFPAVVIVHDLAFERYPQFYKDFRRLRKNTLRAAKRAKKIIAVSEATKKDLIDFYGVSPKKIVVAREGCEPIFKPPARKIGKPYFLFVGALKPIKNIPRILEAYALFLKKTGKEIPFLFAGGDFWLDKEIEPTIKRFGLEKRVKFLGFVSQQRLVRLYQGALAFVSPALWEGFGLTLVEAMACGCPVIAGKSGAQPEVVGRAGILVDPENVLEIAGAMEKLAEDESLREKLSEAGLKQAKNFSWEKFAKELFDIIN